MLYNRGITITIYITEWLLKIAVTFEISIIQCLRKIYLLKPQDSGDYDKEFLFFPQNFPSENHHAFIRL